MVDRRESDAARTPDIAPPGESGARDGSGILPRRITILYVTFGALWIFFSDIVLEWIVPHTGLSVTMGQTIKGWFFVVVTAATLYLIIQRLNGLALRYSAQALKWKSAYRDFAESASDWQWETDDQFRISYLSPRFEEITGIAPEEVVGQSRNELSAEFIDPAIAKTHRETLRNRLPFRDFIYPFKSASGRVLHIKVSGKPAYDDRGAFLGYRGVGADVTEQVNERRMRERLASIIETSTEFAAVARPDGRIDFLNRAARRLIGGDAKGASLTLQALCPQISQAIETLSDGARDEMFQDVAHLYPRPDAELPISYTLALHVDERQQERFLSFIARDLTTERQAQQQLHQAQKMESLGQLTGGVAHDFNNILTIIPGNAGVLKTMEGLSDHQTRLLSMIDAAAEQGATLTSQLLAFARRQTLSPRSIDVNRLVSSMEPMVRRSLGEAVELEVVRAAGLWDTRADPAQLESAILNLCLNARDAMPEGGRLTIETANAHLDSDYARAHEDVRPGQYVLIAVTDTGTGMPPDILEKAFDPFFTTKEAGQGSGLGLSMVYGFAKQSNGHVKLYSELDEGTVARIYLPRATADTQAMSNDERRDSDAPPRGGAERILVVEDDELVREHVKGQLAGLGYRVTAAASGGEALETLRADSGFDLLFTDVVMPGGMNGRELAEHAREINPEIPVLFTSGYTENAIVHHGRLDPGLHLLNKPYRLKDLAEKVRLVIDSGKDSEERIG